MIFKTSKELVDNPTFYLENLKKAIFRVLNSYHLFSFLSTGPISEAFLDQSPTCLNEAPRAFR